MIRRRGHGLARTSRVLLCLTAVLAIAVAGCAGQAPPASDPTPENVPEPTLTGPRPTAVSDVYQLTIEDFNYSQLSVPRGAQVTVVNRDDVEHSVTSDEPGLFDVHVPPNSAEIFVAPTDLGIYPYHCTYHPQMRAELIVE